jgi:hypothetical protein
MCLSRLPSGTSSYTSNRPLELSHQPSSCTRLRCLSRLMIFTSASNSFAPVTTSPTRTSSRPLACPRHHRRPSCCHGRRCRNCDRTSSEGVRRQDQLERFSAKREHNQHIIVHYHIIHSSKSYYNLGSCIRYIKRVEAKITLQILIRVCGNDFSLSQDILFLP